MDKKCSRTGINTSLIYISNSSTLYHITDGESFDSFVLSNTARAVRATQKLDMATAFLVTAIVPPFFSLEK